MAASDDPLATEDLRGRRLAGRYQVLERIGHGGMASVYRATDQQLGRDVALKVFHRGLTSSEDLQRQQSEVRHLAGLTHPSLVTLYDATSDEDGRSFLVLEYVAGPDLRTRLKEGPLTAGETAAVGRDIALALAHIHHRDLIHRDVSPGNVLLPLQLSEEPGVAAKLTDLGIARVVDSGQITATGTLIGTAAYLSPEQVRGAHVSAPSDIYSLGLVLVECLTGQRAFPGPAMESAVARLNRDPDVSDIPPRWRALIAGMTARDPDARPTAAEVAAELTAGDLWTDLLEPTATMPLGPVDPPQVTRVLDHPATTASRWLDWFSTHVRLLAAAGVVLVALVLLIALPSGQKSAAPPPNYPVVPGNLGTHLKQLEHAVAP